MPRKYAVLYVPKGRSDGILVFYDIDENGIPETTITSPDLPNVPTYTREQAETITMGLRPLEVHEI